MIETTEAAVLNVRGQMKKIPITVIQKTATLTEWKFGRDAHPCVSFLPIRITTCSEPYLNGKKELLPIGHEKHDRAQTVWHCMGAQGVLHSSLSNLDSLPIM